MDNTKPNTSLPKQAGKELGRTGTVIQAGQISSEEYNRDLTGLRALQNYEIMRRSDGIVHAALQLIKLPIRATSFSIKAATNPEGAIDDFDQEVADRINHELFDGEINFKDFTREALNFLDYGFSVFEIVYRLSEWHGQKYIGLQKLGSRKQTTIYAWETQEYKGQAFPSGIPGITQQLLTGDPAMISIPMQKLCVFVNDKEGDNYEGISVLRYAYKDWYIMDTLTVVNSIGIEKQAVGIPIIQPKEGATVSTPEMDEAQEVAQNIRANEKSFARLPAGVDLQMLDMKANGTKEVIPTLEYHRRNIFTSILATFMDLGGSSGSGAQSLSKDLTAMFIKSELAVAETFTNAVNEQIIKRLCDLNYTTLPNGYPKLVIGNLSDTDPTQIATSVGSLSTASLITPDAELEDHLRTSLGLPKMPEKYRESYDIKHEAGIELIKNPPTEQAGEGDEADSKITKKAPEKDKKKLEDESKTTEKDAKKKAVRASAEDSSRKLIEVLFLDD